MEVAQPTRYLTPVSSQAGMSSPVHTNCTCELLTVSKLYSVGLTLGAGGRGAGWVHCRHSGSQNVWWQQHLHRQPFVLPAQEHR